MKVIFNNNIEFEVLSADNNANFNGEEIVAMRLTFTLAEVNKTVEELANLKLTGDRIVLVDDNSTEVVFEGYKLDSIRKSYGTSRLTIELTKKW